MRFPVQLEIINSRDKNRIRVPPNLHLNPRTRRTLHATRERGRERTENPKIKPEQDIEMQSARQQQNDEIRPCFCNLHKRRK